MAEAEVIDRQPSGMDGWMKSIGTLEEVPATPLTPPPNKKEEVKDVKAPDKPAATAGTEGDAAAQAAATAATAAATAATAKAAAEKVAAETVVKDDETIPRDAKDWERFKSKRKEREDALTSQVAARDTKIAELTNAHKALEDKLGKPLTADPEIDRLKQENQQLTETILSLKVTEDPRFKKYFESKVQAQIDMAKRIVGKDNSEAIAKALALPDDTDELREMKVAAIEDVTGNLNPVQQSRIGGVLNALDDIAIEKEGEIKKGDAFKQKAGENSEAQRRAAVAARDKVFGDVLSSLQDEKKGMFLYQKKAGDEQWNKDVDERVLLAGKLMTGDGLRPQDIVNASFTAVAFPTLLTAYRNDMLTRDAEITKLKQDLAALQAAQPSNGTSAATAAGNDGQVKLRPDMSPSEATAVFSKNLRAGWES